MLEKAGVAINTGQDASQAARIAEEADKRAAERSNAKRKKALEETEGVATSSNFEGKRIIAEEIATGKADGETELQVIDRLIENLKGKRRLRFNNALKDKPVPTPTDEEKSILAEEGLAQSDDDISDASLEDNDQVIDTLGGISIR